MRRTSPLLCSTLLVYLSVPSACDPGEPEPSEPVAHTTLRPPNQDIYVMEDDGSDPRRLTRHPATETAPAISPNGKWVLFISSRGGINDESLLASGPQPYGELWAIPVEGGRAVRLAHDKWEDGLARWGVVESSSR